MPTLSRTVETGAPPEKVAAFLSDFTTTEQWDPGTISTRRLGPSDAPPAVGTQYENVSSFRGRETTLRYTVVAYEPGSHIRLVGENKTVTSIDDLRFHPHGTGTRVEYTVDFTFKGLARLATPFLRSSLTDLADHGAASMKQTLNSLT